MIKIEISNEMKELHRRYFIKYVRPNFEIKKYKKYRKNQIFTNNNNWNIFINIMNFCYKNSNKLAIGNVDELKNLNEQFNKIVTGFNNFLGDEKKETLEWILLDIFGYHKFIERTIYDVIIDRAKNICKEDTYNKIVEGVILNCYKILFNGENLNYNYSDYIGREKIEELIRKKVYKNTILNNFHQSYFKKLKLWSPYTLVFMSNLRVCPYCNRQYITPLITGTGRMRADLDHFLPKSTYPYFSMSLYNLIPCCKFCNSSLKRTKEFEFVDLHPYQDTIGDHFRYFVEYTNPQNIVLTVKEQSHRVHSFLDTFKIKELVRYHDSIGKEFIQKRLCYPNERLQDLLDCKMIIFQNEKQLQAAIIGYVPEENEINNEVLAKLRRDLAEQLGFISIGGKNEDKKLLEELKCLL